MKRTIPSVLEYMKPPPLASVCKIRNIIFVPFLTVLLYMKYIQCHLTYSQRKYIIKFATDGAILTNTKNAVQGSIKLIPADVNGKVLVTDSFPCYLNKEITVYYYIGMVKSHF